MNLNLLDNIGWLPSTAGILTSLLFVTGCVSTSSTVPDTARFSPTQQEQAELIAFGHATAISKGCRGTVFLNEGVSESRIGPIAARAKAAGVRAQYETATLVGLSKTDAIKIGADYRASRGIVPANEDTWCAAGRFEVANNTRIGKYLVDGTD